MGKSDAVFAKIQDGVKADGAALCKKMKAVFAFEIKGGDKWLLDLKNGSGKCEKGAGKADCTITVGDDDMVAMAEGKLNGMQAFMQGKMKVKGNMMLASKLEQLFASLK